MRRRLTLLAAAAILLVLAAPAYAADKDCGDFASQAQAQAYFKAHGGSATNNVDRLDADSDGIACEALPADINGQGDRGGSSSGRSRAGDTPANQGGTLAHTGPGDVSRTAGAGLLAAGLLLVVATRYRGRHAR